MLSIIYYNPVLPVLCFWGTVYILEGFWVCQWSLLEISYSLFNNIQYSVQICGLPVVPQEPRLIFSFSDRIIESPPAHQWRLEGSLYQSFHRFVFILFPPFLPLELQLSAAGNKLIAEGERKPFSSNPGQCFLPNGCIMVMWTELGGKSSLHLQRVFNVTHIIKPWINNPVGRWEC